MRGDRFILVSSGGGGVPDGIDYWRESVTPADHSTCRALSADVFANRSGVVRCCGK